MLAIRQSPIFPVGLLVRTMRLKGGVLNLSNNREDEARRLFEQGEAFYEYGPVDKAINIFERLLTEYTDLVDIGGIHGWLGCSYYEKGLYDQALTHLGKAYALLDRSQPRVGDLVTLHFLALTHWALRQYAPALQYLDEAEQYIHLYEEEEHYDARFNFRKLKGNVYLWLAEPLKALEEYRTANDYIMGDDPADGEREAEMLYCIGRAHLVSGDLEAAENYFRRVDLDQLEKSVHDEYHLDMEDLCVQTEKYVEALQHFEKLQEIGIHESARPRAYNYAGRAYYYLGDGQNARKYFEESGKYPSNREWIAESNRAFLEELAKAGH